MKGFSIPDGEKVLFYEHSPTFHRAEAEELELALSDQAIYLPRRRLSRWGSKKFRRVPLKDVRILKATTVRSWLSSVLGWVTLVLACGAVLYSAPDMLQGGEPVGSRLRQLIAPLMGGVIGYGLMAKGRPRPSLVITLSYGTTRWDAPPADRDEYEYDRRVLRKFLAACRAAGVMTDDDAGVA